LGQNDDDASTLTELGLSHLQAKVYLCLVRSNCSTAQEISAVTRVARPDVYRVLAELEEAGFVEKIISRPEKFQAIAIENCIFTLMQKRILKTAELQQKTRILADKLRCSSKSEELTDNFQFMLIPARAPVYAKAEKMLRSVQKCVCLLGMSRRMQAWLSNYESPLEQALARKVECRMILPNVEDDWCAVEPFNKLVEYSTFSLRVLPGERRTVFGVWDRREILLSTSEVDTPYPYPTLWSNNKAIVDLAQDHFDLVWEKARKAEK
jgi:sugar-specific transcriptional regulator TrmB